MKQFFATMKLQGKSIKETRDAWKVSDERRAIIETLPTPERRWRRFVL